MRLGPGAMVAAAFIGPGTVTTAASAGASTGLGLLWAVAFSIVATLILQELALRSALVTQRDLASLMRTLGEGRWWGRVMMILIVLAIGAGNAAYQSGNLSGAGLGLQAAFDVPLPSVVAVATLIAAGLIYNNHYLVLERVLVTLVALMAVLFCGLAILLVPDLTAQPMSRLVPTMSSAHLTLILALIGTTVVPYNLFLHATAARQRWAQQPLAEALSEARRESHLSILIGGAITAAIVMVAAASMQSTQPAGVIPTLIAAIEDILPGWGRLLVGLGLFAAGITSSITAPLAAGWAVCGAMGWPYQQRSKWIALLVLTCGAVFALFATRPSALIISAQAANALLLPIIAVALMAVANHQALLGQYRNKPATNALAVLIVAVVSLLALRKLFGLL